MNYFALTLDLILIALVAFLAWGAIRDAARVTRLRAALDQIVAGGTESKNGTAARLARIADLALLADDRVQP